MSKARHRKDNGVLACVRTGTASHRSRGMYGPAGRHRKVKETPTIPPCLVGSICAVAGVLAAFIIVLAWFPSYSGIWRLPLQEIDAPAHYYYIRKIVKYGPVAALHLWDNGAFYPPVFHLLAAGLVALGRIVGVNVSVYVAFNAIWLLSSGVLWPAGVSLWTSYWTRRVDASAAWRPFSCAMSVIMPVLAVSSASHPFQSLAAGPLVSFGLSTSLLPFWLYATLRVFDALRRRRYVLRRLSAMVLSGCLCMLAHPRSAFTWLLLMAPFIVLRLPWKFIVATVLSILAAALALFFYMSGHYLSNRYFNPSSWFHTFVPSRGVGDALKVLVSDDIAGVAGWFMAVVSILAVCLALAAVVKPGALFCTSDSDACVGTHDQWVRRDAAALLLDFGLIGLVYVCSASLTGWFPNIVTAVWQRTETRPLTMIPLGLLPLVAFAACAAAGARSWVVSPARLRGLEALGHGMRKFIVVIVLGALVVGCQVGNVNRAALGENVADNVRLGDGSQDGQINKAKYRVLKDTVDIAGTNALIISDPLNGSMYAATMFDANMLFPIYNEAHEKSGVVFSQVEAAFGSGDGASLLAASCPVSFDSHGRRSSEGGGPVYFLSMGPQVPSLQMFTFRQQYDVFHDRGLIDKYAGDGTMKKVKDFGVYGRQSRGWALYRLGCGGAAAFESSKGEASFR